LHLTLTMLLLGCSGDTEQPTSSGTDPTATETEPVLPTLTDSGDGTVQITEWPCVLEADADPDYAQQLGCQEDFDQLASLPLDASIPGARSVKTVVDQLDGDALYFQNSVKYPIHWEFAFNNLSGDGLPLVPDLAGFNLTEYYSPDRRFILGAVTFYEGPELWVYEIAPYDSASPEMVERAFDLIRENTWFGPAMGFHPSSKNIEDTVVPELPDDIPIITTEDLFAGIDYQPLNLGTSVGTLTFYEAEELREAYVNPCEIVVLNEVPNDISITAGIITQEFQTPLAHINVLAQNRGTPNMGLRGAFDDEELRSLENTWVQLTVDPFGYAIEEVPAEEGLKACEASRPEPLEAQPMDLTVTEMTDAEDILDLAKYDLDEALEVAIPAFGGKASHYGALTQIGPEVPVPDAFAIPMYFYDQFMTANGFYEDIDALLADEDFQVDPAYRSEQLTLLQLQMIAAPLDPDFQNALLDKLNTEYPGTRMRFRSSTNAEDLGAFTGAGLYTSQSGDPLDPKRPVDAAVKTVWASVWGPRAFEEREWYGIDHTQVGMSVLVHRSFPDEEANGVAITANIFDTTGVEPGFYVNVQAGDESVVLPEPGVVTDQFIYYYDSPGQPVVYLASSNLIEDGETVLTNAQINELGNALAAIRDYFYPVYGADGGFYGMDTEFKFDQPLDDPDSEPVLFMKQARPYPGWNAAGTTTTTE